MNTYQKRMAFLARVKLLLSQAFNALFFDGDPDEPFSARAWREYLASTPGWNETFYRIDNILGAGHCRKVWADHQERIKQRTTA